MFGSGFIRSFPMMVFAVTLFIGIPAEAQEDPVVENNLFSPSRTPHRVSQSEGQIPRTSPSDLQLDGILLLGGKKQAIFKVSSAVIGEDKAKKNPYITVPEGGQAGSYKVVSIQKSQVIVEQGGEQLVIPLVKPNKQPPPISVPLPVVSPAIGSSPASTKSDGGSSGQPQPQTEKATTTSRPSESSQPQFHSEIVVGETSSQEGEQLRFPSPEEFEKLGQEEKEELIKKMQTTMGKKIKSLKKQ